ncbi:amidohydrolase family protein [Nocardia nova]|uniref:amidohydrolase family protein n=1 Tax=Nocardia nova TaxID=37330 RepID=UPI0025B0B394|nr:amidohydrolase family protein [Nocardia nova]
MTARILHVARVVTGLSTVHAPGTVVVDDKHIAWVGTPDQLPDTWTTNKPHQIHLPQATLLPGLIDAHVHLAFDHSADPHRAAEKWGTAVQQLLHGGITTARDLGAPHHTDISAVAGTSGPRILSAGVPLTIPGGHCDEFGGSVTTAADIDRIVSHNAERGAAWIKVMVTGGFTSRGPSSPYSPQFTDTQLADIVAAARDHDLPVAAHAHGTAGIRQAVEAGVDSLEHCTWMTENGFHLDHGIVNAIAEQRILVCPTINHLARHASGRLPWPVRRAQLVAMLSAGVRIVPGSDAGIPHTPHHLYGRSLPAYTDLGFSPAEVVDLVTRRAAEALRVGHLTGTLTAGRAADLIAAPGDPTRELHALTTPILVMSSGHLHYLDINAEEDTPR